MIFDRKPLKFRRSRMFVFFLRRRRAQNQLVGESGRLTYLDVGDENQKLGVFFMIFDRKSLNFLRSRVPHSRAFVFFLRREARTKSTHSRESVRLAYLDKTR